MNLSPTIERFVLHWGEMGSRWGVNRSVAQIHALLYLANEPADAETIAETLGIARSNVSSSLKELQGWGLVRPVHVIGDRRERFETSRDPWDLVMTIVEERKRREIDPTLTVLRDCVRDSEDDAGLDPQARARLKQMLGLMEELTGWYQEMRKLPRATLTTLLRLGTRVVRFLPKSA